MKVDIVTDGEIRTTIPVIIEIKEAKEKPDVFVKDLGIVPVTNYDGGHRAEFFVQQPGNYEINVKTKQESWSKEIYIKEQQYLTFNKEFGFFTILFILMMTGVVLWVRKIKKKSD